MKRENHSGTRGSMLPRFRHIRSKLLFSYVFILIIPCVLLGYGFLHVFDQMLVRQKLQDSEKEALVLSENMEYTLNGITDVLSDFCSDAEVWAYFHHQYTYPDSSIKGYYNLIQPAINRYLKLHSEILSASLYTNNPTVVTNQSEIHALVSGSEEENLMKHLLDNRLVWTMVSIEQKGQPRLVAARVLSLYQQPVGLFCVRIDPDSLQRLVGTEREAGSASIISHEGRIVLSSVESLIGQNATDTELAQALNHTQEGEAELTLAGQKHEAIIIPFQVDDCNTDWYLVQTETAEELHRLANANSTVVSGLGFIILTLMGLLSVWFANGLTRRLSTISSGIAQVSMGDFSVRVNVGGEDEVSALATSLNGMTGRLDNLVNENAEIRIQKRELEIAEREAKLYALQSQINPHFIFNTLEAVQFGIHTHLTGTEGIVNLLARNLRRIASWESDTVRLCDELVNIDEHLKIQQFRYGDKLRYRIDVAPDVMNIVMPKLLLQPLVENAVTHGVAMKLGGGTVTVSGRREKDTVILSVEDDGVGMDELTREELRQTLHLGTRANLHGIGLKNVYDRLMLYYGDKARFDLISAENEGTRVTLTLLEVAPDASVDC
ncbi:MAG: histidine kinase [Eubacteriales bacterium]|nr:histidine kinase [Eubacteriales bacterium]